MPKQPAPIDAFILFNEQEDSVESIVSELDSRGVKTHFWRRDISIGDEWQKYEEARLREARSVVVFLGERGWGPTHLEITGHALELRKRVLPVLIGTASSQSMDEANSLFRTHRYVDLQKSGSDALDRLADAILQHPADQSGRIDQLLNALIDGSEEERSNVLRQLQVRKGLDRQALAARLREEIVGRFRPALESESAAVSNRPPQHVPAIRSWMLSALIWTECDHEESRRIILDHLRSSLEPIHTVRYWVLAGLYQVKAIYLDKAVEIALDDSELDVAFLAQAITARDPSGLSEFRSRLQSGDFERAWPVLRALRIVARPEFASDVCTQLVNDSENENYVYDSLHALCHPSVAREAVKVLSQTIGVVGVVDRVITAAYKSAPNAARDFTSLIGAFDSTGSDVSEVDQALAQARQNSRTGSVARRLQDYLRQYRRHESKADMYVAGFASDTNDIDDDRLDIQEDVQTLAAVITSTEVSPPLAIGLFGDWGSGKSYFMKSLISATQELAGRAARPNGKSAFCQNVVSIEFNAWHYVDTNLWASLASHILQKLAEYVMPGKSPEEQQTEMLSKLESAQDVVKAAEAEKQRAQKLIDEQQGELMRLQLAREQKQFELRDLQGSDLQTLLGSHAGLKAEMNHALETLGVPTAISSVNELRQIISEGYSVKGRITAWFAGLIQTKQGKLFWALLLFALLGIPTIAWVTLHFQSDINDFITATSVVVAELITIVTAATVALRSAMRMADTSLRSLENARQLVDEILATKRKNPTNEESSLQNDIAILKAKEHEASAQLSAASARVSDLEERIRTLRESRSLSRFLTDRTSSEDYSKHLGLISTIRRDFESLSDRLTNHGAKHEDNMRRVDRIVLYIDDLDRCPHDKVMAVLQAVHLLMAYPLFVVVVGVDPRWLLHSLGKTYSAFLDGEETSDRPATPQNYLEKIFQISFRLRPMTSAGFGRLVDKLMLRDSDPEVFDSAVEESGEETTHIEPTVVLESSISRKIPLPVAADDFEPGRADTSTTKVDTTGQPQSRALSGEVAKKRSPEFVVLEEALTIRTWEANFAAELFPLIPTPRAAKRFSNLYRLLKASVGVGSLETFEGTAAIPGDFRLPMLLLAIQISNPEGSAELFSALTVRAVKGHEIVGFLKRIKSLGLQSPAFDEIEQAIDPIISASSFPGDADLFLKWMPRVSRFSFHIG